MARRPALMTRAISISLLLLGFACGAAAQPEGDTSGSGWSECLQAPVRACVLREAVEAARTIHDLHSAANELSRIADAQSDDGLSAEAAATIDQSLRFAMSIPDKAYLRDDAIEAIAKVQAKAGEIADALESVGSIRNRYVQAEVIGAIAVADGKAGRLDEALRRVQAIENLPDRALTMRRVAWDLRDDSVARGDDGKIVAALTDVQAIEQQYPPPQAITGVHHPSEFIPALAIIAQAQARAGKIADAMRTAGLVISSGTRAQAFATVAVELVRTGAVAAALKVASAADGRWERHVVLEQILDPRPVPELFSDEATISVSSVTEAPDVLRDVIATFTDREESATALGIVAVALAKAGRLAEAIEFAEAIDQGKPRAIAWHAIADAQVRAGLATQSIVSFDRASQAALSFQPHDQLLSKIAISQAGAGQITEALRVTQLIGGTMATTGSRAQVMIDGKLVSINFDRRRALYAIAKAQSNAGSTAEALQTARALVFGPDIIGDGLGVVAEGLAEAGRVPEAIDAAMVEDNFYSRSTLLASIAKAEAAAGRIDEAEQVTRHVAWGPDRVAALVSIAAAQFKARLLVKAMASFTQAMEIAQSLPYKNLTADALMSIAAELPD